MSSWTIYSKNGVAKWTVKDPEYHDTWMGEEFITVSIVSAVPLQLEIGDYLTYRGLTYSIYNIPSALKQARSATYGEGFKYDNVKFSARSTELTETRFLDYVLFDNELHYTSLPTFSFYCNDVDDLVDRLQANTYRKGDAQWYFITPSYLRTIQRYEEGSAARTQAIALWISVFGDDTSVEPEYEKTDVNISVDKQSVWDGMSHIKKEFGLNYVTRDRVCIIGGEGIAVGHIFKYGKGEGLYQIERSADPDQLVVTKLYAYGSDKNLPLRYYSDINMRPYLKITGDYHTSSTATTLSVELENLDNPTLAFTNKILDNGSLQWYTFNCKIGDIECGGQVEVVSGIRLLLFATGTPSGVDNTKYTSQANIDAIKDAIDGGEEDVIFLTGVNINQFPSNRKTALTEGLPNNMAVNALMLPGFPMYPLSDLCRYTYDSVNDKTTYEIRKTPTSEYSEFMVVDGNHPITFSNNALDPFLLSGNYTDLGTKEGDAHFVEENDDNGLQEVYPSIEGMTVGDIEGSSSTERLDEILQCDIIDDDGVYEEGATVRNFHLVLKDLGFNLKEAFDNAGSSMTLSMKDGYCGGRDFNVTGVVADTNGTWRLTVERCHDEALDLWFPYSYNASIGETPVADEAYQIRTGDHFVLTGIDIGDTSYVWAASMKMLRKSILWLLNNDYTRFTYLPHVDEIYMARQHDEAVANSTTSLHDTLKAGMLMLFEDDDLDVSGSIFIDSITIKEHGNNGIPTYDVVLREDKQVGTIQRIQNQISSISSYISGGGGGMSIEAIRSLIRTYGAENFLSKTVADAAQGVITLDRGLLFGNGETGITQNGDATLTSVQTKGYSGTDIISDKGFKVWEDSEGKSHLITDYFSARVKALLASLEIRKIEHSAGNRIESPAGNTLALVKKYGIDSQGDPYEIVDKWYARRYGFGLSWGFKLVYSVGQYFGFWQQDPSATVAFYRCYWTAEDKEDKKAVQNNWRIGDQAYCQTFNLDQIKSSYASNKMYWRLVVGAGKEEIEGVEYAYIDLSNIAENVTVVDEQGRTYVCSEGYKVGSDKPEAGDDVACFGNQITPSTRGSAIQYITYNPDANSNDGVPCVKMYSGINSFASLDNFVIQKQSPTGVFVRADKFTIYSASGTGMSGASSTLICDRGDYASDTDYAYGDLVQYHGSSWLCIASTTISNEAPADGSSYWKIYARKGMSAPQITLDSASAIVSADSNGKITSISAASGLPTTIQLYVEGNLIPVENWNLASSRLRWGANSVNLTGGQAILGFGITVNSITPSTNSVGVTWKYEPERVYSIEDIPRVVHPVINSMDISVHIVFTYNGGTQTADISMPMIVQRAGASGANGLNSATVFLYQRASSTPATPSSSLTYTFATGVLSGTLGNWSQVIPASDGNPCYVIQATAISTSATDTIESTEWQPNPPIIMVEDGEDGATGYNTATIYLYQRYVPTTQAPTPNLPSSTLTYTFSTKTLSGTLGNWLQNIPSGDNPLFVTAATAYSNTDTDSIPTDGWSTPVIMAKNGEDGQSVLAEYSATGAANSWHSSFQTGDIYIHYSYDGGSTWTTAIRFVGKSIEFEKGIRHFASYNDLWNYLVAKQASYTNSDFGYYLTDTDDGSTPEACLWYFYTQSSDPRDLQYVSLPQSDEVNYLTSYDGHLWNAEDGDTAWADMGVIQGADGRGISSITEKYLASPLSSGVTTSTSGWTTSVQALTNTNKYLWNYEIIAYTDGSSTTTTPAIIGVYGDKGEDGTNGKGITSVTNYYLATSASSGVTRSTSGWTTGFQQVTSTNKYLWNYEDILYTDGQHVYTEPHIIGTFGVDGADGIDGIVITLDPAQAIFQQNEDALDTFSNLPFVATVRVWKGATLLNPSSYTVELPNNSGDQDNHCLFHTPAVTGNQVQIDGINYVTVDNTRVYYDSGKVKIKVTYSGVETFLYLNWAANLLGSWKMSVKNDTMQMVANSTIPMYDDNGELTLVPFSSIIGQTSENVFMSVEGLKGRTGIDVEDGTITLDAERTIVTNDFEVKRVKTIPAEDGIQIQIAEGLFQVFGPAGVANWRFGVDENGNSILSYYNDSGQELYNLGPSGISHIQNLPEKFNSTSNVIMSSAFIGKNNDTTYIIDSTYTQIVALLKNSAWTSMFVPNRGGTSIYIYGARKTVTPSGTTIYYGQDNVPTGEHITYAQTATIAEAADGKLFTNTLDLMHASTVSEATAVMISSYIGIQVSSFKTYSFNNMSFIEATDAIEEIKNQYYYPYKTLVYDNLSSSDPGYIQFPTPAQAVQGAKLYTAILRDYNNNTFTVLQSSIQ